MQWMSVFGGNSRLCPCAKHALVKAHRCRSHQNIRSWQLEVSGRSSFSLFIQDVSFSLFFQTTRSFGIFIQDLRAVPSRCVCSRSRPYLLGIAHPKMRPNSILSIVNEPSTSEIRRDQLSIVKWKPSTRGFELYCNLSRTDTYNVALGTCQQRLKNPKTIYSLSQISTSGNRSFSRSTNLSWMTRSQSS